MRNVTPRRFGMLVRLCLLATAARAMAAPAPEPTHPANEPPHLELPVAEGKRPLTFVVYGDTRFTPRSGDIANPTARQALVGKIVAENPQAILIGGDLVYEGDSPEDYATFRNETAEWARRGIPVYPALGNHEFRGCSVDDPHSACLENWWQAFGNLQLRPWRWYSLSIGPTVRVLVLDSDSSLKAGSEQRGWLEQQVEGAGPEVRFLLIVLHYPPMRDPVFPHGKDEAEVEKYLSARSATLPVKVIVIGSHVHNYERYMRSGVTYLVSGGGGAKPVPAFRMAGELSQLRTAVNFHFMRFTLEGNRLTVTMVRFNADGASANPWSEPDRFEVTAR